jgi:hypothetical protein|tara:strand:+ start:174 stop:608 length:435 start_codon:yes stop_codon:yes gene_type:complete
MSTIINEEKPDDFIKYMFEKEPKPKDSIQLECPDIVEGKNIHLHIFEQLLMIYVQGLKHLWSDEEGKVDLTNLTEDNINLMKRYFESINYNVNIEVFDLQTYQFKFPDYFKNQENITDKTFLPDFFYETQGSDTNMYRISFDYL